MAELFHSRSRKAWLTAGAAVVAVAAVALTVVALVHELSPPAHGEATAHFVCDACGHEWNAAMTAEPVCPKCGARPLLRSFYRCPRCGKVFAGLERRKLAPGSFRYRRPGQEEWQKTPPAELTCPGCGFTSADIYRHSVPTGPDGRPSSDRRAPRGDD